MEDSVLVGLLGIGYFLNQKEDIKINRYKCK